MFASSLRVFVCFFVLPPCCPPANRRLVPLPESATPLQYVEPWSEPGEGSHINDSFNVGNSPNVFATVNPCKSLVVCCPPWKFGDNLGWTQLSYEVPWSSKLLQHRQLEAIWHLNKNGWELFFRNGASNDVKSKKSMPIQILRLWEVPVLSVHDAEWSSENHLWTSPYPDKLPHRHHEIFSFLPSKNWLRDPRFTLSQAEISVGAESTVGVATKETLNVEKRPVSLLRPL